MALSNQQKHLVSKSFQQVAIIADTAAELFYNRLWEINPETRELFKATDMQAQGQKLMQTLAVAVNSLEKMESLSPVLENLGKRHIAYGVKASHYQSVGEALLWTLEKGLGDAFNEEMKDAWATVYGALATTAMKAYEEAEGQA